MTNEDKGRYQISPDFDETIWNDFEGPADLRLDFLDWWVLPQPRSDGVRLDV